MQDTRVSKFGGSSVANAAQIRKVCDIIARNDKRRVIVVSAPGRSQEGEEKVTDHLLNIATQGAHFLDQRKEISPEDSKQAVLSKFNSIAKELKVDAASILESLRTDLETDLEGDRRIAFLASRGERTNAQIIALYLNSIGMDAELQLPENIGLLVSNAYLDAKVVEPTYAKINTALKASERKKGKTGGQGLIHVFPGYYGITKKKEIAVFSRGGSDLTGGELAYAIDAELYENWTDVSGVFEVDPRIIPEARVIPRLTFKEIRLLSSKGFNVFHLDAMLKCKARKIPINIRNTNRPDDPGTLILNERVPEEGVVGIARLDNMAYIYIEKDMLGEEIGFTAELLRIFGEFGVNTYHYPTDKDDIAVLVEKDDLRGNINELRRAIDKRLKPDFMNIVYNLSILTPVGHGLHRNSYPIVDAIHALGEEHIPLELLDQSPSQICFHVGVNQSVADDALRILYKTLVHR